MNRFKKGDIVRCIEPKGRLPHFDLPIHMKFKVTGVSNYGNITIDRKGTSMFRKYTPDRFKLVNVRIISLSKYLSND